METVLDHTAKESVANCASILEFTVDRRPWSRIKAFLRRQMDTQVAPSIQPYQYKELKQYAKEVGVFPTASGRIKWLMSFCMN